MKWPYRILLRVALCMLSILVLVVLGAVGEILLNLNALLLHEQGIGPEDTHEFTRFVLANFRLNGGDFRLSLTPLMLLMVGVVGVGRTQRRAEWYWFALAGVWLLVAGYFLLFALAMLMPFHIPLAAAADSPVPDIIRTVNISLAVAMAAMVAMPGIGWLLRRVRCRSLVRKPIPPNVTVGDNP